MKPEILIFSLLTWALYLIEQYFYTGQFKYVYFVIPFLILIFNAKASTIGIVGVFLLLLVFQNRKIIEIKPFALAVIIFLFGFVTIQYENYKVTNNSFLTITQELEYKNSANINVLFNLNILDILKNPKLEFSYTENVKSIHADSIVNILYWIHSEITLGNFLILMNSCLQNLEKVYLQIVTKPKKEQYFMMEYFQEH